MKIVTISGASKDVGKTNLAVSIIKRYKGLAALKYSLHYAEEPGVITDVEILNQSGTDTAKFLEAGANPVFWVRTDERRLGLELKRALSLLPPKSKVIIEGNSVLNHLKPAFAIFIMNSCWDGIKPSALDAIRKVNAIVETNRNEEIREKILSLNSYARVLTFDPNVPKGKDFQLLLEDLQNVWREDMREKILEEVREAAKEGRLACRNARKIAEELGVPYREIGEAANELKIKIVQCELGCF